MTEAEAESEVQVRLRRCQQWATLLDGAWVIPFTRWRVGLDSIVGLLPVAGDFVSALLGLAIVWQARKLSAPKALQIKMLSHIGLDFLLGSVPIVGDIADVAFRKNIRNVALLEEWVQRERVPEK
ncbi:MAG: hypothetical protein ACI9OO_000012 [Bacteroidia bacterium]|jgi:hypothetical protein